MSDQAQPFIASPLARDVIVADGPDAGAFLQGQLSQDVADMAVDSSRWSLLLQPQGKTEAWLRVTREDDHRYLLDVDAGFGAAVIARLSRFLLRTRVELTSLSTPDSNGWALRGPREVLDELRWEPPDDVFFDAPLGLPGLFGRDLLATSPFDPPPGTIVVDADRLEHARIAAAIPAMGHEITPDVIPAELGQWLIDVSVSFTKGCYTGQELVARIDSRGGNVPKHLRLLEVTGSAPVPAGSKVLVADHGEVGTVTSSAGAEGHDHQLALAFIKRVVDAPCEATVITDRGARGAVVWIQPPDIRPDPT